jgi:hypothetical protein
MYDVLALQSVQGNELGKEGRSKMKMAMKMYSTNSFRRVFKQCSEYHPTKITHGTFTLLLVQQNGVSNRFIL